MSDDYERESPRTLSIRHIIAKPVFIIVSAMALVMIAFAFGALNQGLSWRGMAIGAGLFFLVAFMNIIVNAVISKVENQDYFDSRLEILNSIILANNLNWIVNQKYMHEIEKASAEIWAFAPELTFAIQPGSTVFEGLQQSLKKGTRYKVFMPNTANTHRIIGEYRRLHVFKPGQVEFILIPPDEYIFHTVITIYDPRLPNPKALEWLPVESLMSWIEMDEKHTGRVVGIGENLLQRYVQEGLAGSELVKELQPLLRKTSVKE